MSQSEMYAIYWQGLLSHSAFSFPLFLPFFAALQIDVRLLIVSDVFVLTNSLSLSLSL